MSARIVGTDKTRYLGISYRFLDADAETNMPVEVASFDIFGKSTSPSGEVYHT